MKALGTALQRTEKTESLCVRNNKLTDKGGYEVLQLKSDNLLMLDMSYNPAIGKLSYKAIAGIASDGYKLLQTLNLEGNSMGTEIAC